MVSLRATLAGFGAVAAVLFQPCAAYPHSTHVNASQSPSYDVANIVGRAEPQDFYLRIMPLGASITAGDWADKEDPGGNGYRKHLRDKLRFDGWKVNMVGNYMKGDMKDKDHEGYSGDRVSQVQARAKQSVRNWVPNVVLINAGTNDATQNGSDESVSGTRQRMRELIDTVFSESPNAVVVLSTLLPNSEHDAAQPNVDFINDGYRSLYREYVPPGREDDANHPFKVVLADMVAGDFIIKDHIHDGTHPNREGNRRMASVWDWAINEANERGWLSAPSDSSLFTDGEGSTTCRKSFGSGNKNLDSGRQVLHASNPVIRDDGTYKHASRPRKDREISDTWIARDRRLFFAQLVNVANAPKGGERDEYIIVVKLNNPDRLVVRYRLNEGDGVYSAPVQVDDAKITCDLEGVHWGDVNGDGLDDLICIQSNGEMFVSLNEGGVPPKFRSIGSYKKPEKGLGRAHVRLGDIDGDGRLDYCVIPGYGDIFCWRNGGLGEKASYWQNMGSGGPIFKAKGMGDITGVRFVDINGDGRADWIWMDKTGKVTTYINQRGGNKGMVPRWLSAGVTHQGMGENVGDNRQEVTFGRIFGDNGRADYSFHKAGIISLYENLGSGGKYQKGDGIYWGDMTGTGVDDYIWISPEGEANVFLNKNTKENSDLYKTPAWSTPIPVDTGLDRRALHIGDWDGDGKADIIGITNRNTGSLKVWHSRWDGSKFNWDVQDIPNSAKCNQGWGLGYFDHGAYFADISGSGRVDYICMEPSGTTRAWLRDSGGNWLDAGQVKFHEDLDRANYRFADVNGDGRADLIWTDKFTGNGRVWYNSGKREESDRGNLGGSLFEWERPVQAYLGSSRGPNMHFPNLGGQGRADMVGTNPTTGHAWIWFNTCPAGGDDLVDGVLINPRLDIFTPLPDPGGPIDDWFCGSQPSDWTPKLWRSHNVGRWLVQRCELYLGVAGNWPDDENIEGVPRVISAYNGLHKDNAWNWPGPGCTKVTNVCGVSSSDLRESVCEETPQRPFALWAMRNFARFLQAWYNELTESIDTTSLFTAKFSDTFLYYSAEDASADPASWLTIVAGILATVGVFAPPPISAGSNAAAGLLTAAAGTAGMIGDAPAQDPRFTNFGDMQEKLGSMKIAVTTALDGYFERLFVETPPEKHWERGTELARILENGAFADQDFTSTPKHEEMVNMIKASLINEMWNSGKVAIIKWSNQNELSTSFGYSPCFKTHSLTLYNKYAVVCEMNQNFLITPVLTKGLSFNQASDIKQFIQVGQDVDTLKANGLSPLKVIESAMRTQKLANSFIPRGLDITASIFKELAENPTDNDILDDILTFNLPVCDLDLLPDIYLQEDCESMTNMGPATASECIHYIIADNCKRLRLGNSQWPYGT